MLDFCVHAGLLEKLNN